MIYKFAVVFSILFILFIINLVRKNKLDEKYSILWLVFGVIIFILALFPSLVDKIADMFNVFYAPSLLLLFGIITVGVYIVHITIVITKQNKMIIKLTQEVGILKERIDTKEKTEE